MRATRHAQRRFTLRICATDDPVHGVCKMWHTGRAATTDDVLLFRSTVEADCQYRVGTYNNEVGLLVARGDYIVTLIPMKLGYYKS